ncbi:hypothetical protein EYC84_009411 [Monilinia fructicola]|uniref:Uncharacterized protein n=1 Tax=Monilinia fructicola TaxID=38448 RepID=A0A5M9J9V7_MONFR|nr:hypothetical protein EYC84_009411 [Monilinia fructicola]
MTRAHVGSSCTSRRTSFSAINPLQVLSRPHDPIKASGQATAGTALLTIHSTPTLAPSSISSSHRREPTTRL